MDIARIQGWEGSCRNRTPTPRRQVLRHTDGGSIVAVCIRRRLRHDFWNSRQTQCGDLYLSIQTWEDHNLIHVGFQLATEGNQIQEAVSLSRDEISLLLTLEEECSR